MKNTYGYIGTSRQRIQETAGNDPKAQALQIRQGGEVSANLHNTFTQGQADQLLRVSRRNVNYAGRVLSEETPAAHPVQLAAGPTGSCAERYPVWVRP